MGTSAGSNVTWKIEVPGRGWSSPVIWGDQIWMTTAFDAGRSLRALSVHRARGEILRQVEVFTPEEPDELHKNNSHASPSPVVEADRVYVHFGSMGTAHQRHQGLALAQGRPDQAA